MLDGIDKNATSRLFLQQVGSMSYYLGIMQEVAKEYGFDLRKGCRAAIHPDNMPDNLKLEYNPGKHPLILSKAVDKDKIEFFRLWSAR